MDDRRSAARLGEQLELRRSLLDDTSRRFEQPVEARVEARISARRVTREGEVTVEPCVDALRFTMEAKEQQLGRGFGEMKEREHEEAHSRLVGRVDGLEERGLAQWALFTDRRDELHRVFETG